MKEPVTIAIDIIYLWRQNLIASILLHFPIDTPILISTILTKLGQLRPRWSSTNVDN